MEGTRYPWWLRQVTEDIALELWTGEEPHLVATEGSNRIKAELSDVRKLAASPQEGTAYLAVAVASRQMEGLEAYFQAGDEPKEQPALEGLKQGRE